MPDAKLSGRCVALVEVGRTERHTVEDDIEAVIRGLKAQPVGEIEVAGPG